MYSYKYYKYYTSVGSNYDCILEVSTRWDYHINILKSIKHGIDKKTGNKTFFTAFYDTELNNGFYLNFTSNYDFEITIYKNGRWINEISHKDSYFTEYL